jgi:hypothetical protein
MKNILFLSALVLCAALTAQTKQDRPVSGFNAIKVSSAIKVILTMGDQESLTFEAEDDVLPKLKSEVRNGELHLFTEGNTNTKKDMKAYVTARQLQGVEVTGAASLKLTNNLQGDKFSMESSGAGNIEMAIKVNELDCDITGAANIELKGEAARIMLDLSGASDFSASKLTSENVKIKATGASKAQVSASKTLKVNATGASKVIYSGAPKDKDIFTSGAASVKSDG